MLKNPIRSRCLNFEIFPTYSPPGRGILGKFWEDGIAQILYLSRF